MRPTLALCTLVLCAFVSLFAQAPQSHRVILHVLKANQDGELVATAKHPAFGFHVESGAPAEDSWLVCEQSTETRSKDGLSYPVIVATCGDAKLVLTGVDLGE